MRPLPSLMAGLVCSFSMCGPASAYDCTFDAGAHQRVAALVAGLHPGGRIAEGGSYTWDLPGGASESFGYGGCNDLGSVATRTEKSARPLTMDEIHSSAKALAAKYWVASLLHTNAAEVLTQTLQQQAYDVTRLQDGGLRIRLHPAHSAFVKLYVSYTYEHGEGTVLVGYQDGL